MSFVKKGTEYHVGSSLEQEYALVRTTDELDMMDKVRNWTSSEIKHDQYTIFRRSVDFPNKNLIALDTGSYYIGVTHYGEQFLAPVALDRKDEMFAPVKSLDKVAKDIEHFIASRSIYDSLKVPYRRGYLIYGPPGNGKTTMIRELIKPRQADCVTVWCDDLPNRRLAKALSDDTRIKILIFEEITTTLSSEVGINRFLSFMDGDGGVVNSIIIGTTNSPEDLAANVANRPSRFDLVFEATNPGRDDCLILLRGYLGDIPAPALPYGKLSYAHIKELVLLHKLYNISLEDAYSRLKIQIDAFNSNFADAGKPKFGVV